MQKLIISMVVFSFCISAEVPTFEDIGALEDLGVKAYDFPNSIKLCFPYITFIDWDGDEKKDVLLGGVDWFSRGGGKVYFYKNTSPSGNTQFNSGVSVQAGGNVINFNAN